MLINLSSQHRIIAHQQKPNVTEGYLANSLRDERFWLLVEDGYSSLSQSHMCDVALSLLVYMKTRKETSVSGITCRLCSPSSHEQQVHISLK